jgi:acyl transferase domain-containing protein
MHVLPLSARSPGALQALARASCELLKGCTNVSLRDVCYTAAVRRGHHEYRLAITGRTRGEVIERLEVCAADPPEAGVARGRTPADRQRRVVFVFPGQGSQWLGMGRQLLQEEPVFRAAIEDCDRVLRRHVEWSLAEQLTASVESSRLNDIDIVQPVLFGMQVALAALWRSWGIEPAAVVGHSMGEVAAAYVAGALTLQDAASCSKG